MKIVDKIDTIKTNMQNDREGNAVLGEKMRTLASLAMIEGINSNAWEQYMRIFASNDKQLQRLTGKDEDYNVNTTWGKTALAYIVAGGVCGISTVGDGPPLTPSMRTGLDSNGLDSTDNPAFDV